MCCVLDSPALWTQIRLTVRFDRGKHIYRKKNISSKRIVQLVKPIKQHKNVGRRPENKESSQQVCEAQHWRLLIRFHNCNINEGNI